MRRKTGAGPVGRRGAPPRPRRHQGSLLVHHYQGPEVLERLLGRAGATVDARGAIERFARAIRDGRVAPAVIPALFAGEPRFAGPEDALALYGNLLGAWDLLEDGVDPAELLAPRPPEPEPAPGALPEEEPAEGDEGPPAGEPVRGAVEGKEIPPELVDATWRWLDALPNREKVRGRDRYENAQPDLAEWARTQGLDGVAQDVFERLVFELSEMFDRAFGERYGLVKFRSLLGAAPEEGRRAQPAVAAYVDEFLAEVEADDEAPIEPGQRSEVERLALAALAAMDGAVARRH
jgi:hypothetical protein